MPTIEVKGIIIQCRAHDCFNNLRGFCNIEEGEIQLNFGVYDDLDFDCIYYTSTEHSK